LVALRLGVGDNQGHQEVVDTATAVRLHVCQARHFLNESRGDAVEFDVLASLPIVPYLARSGPGIA
jgi:hypothetical protein